MLESSFAQLLFELGERKLFFYQMMLVNRLHLKGWGVQTSLDREENTHKSDAKHHKIPNLIFSYSTGVVDHRVDPLDECIMGTSHIPNIQNSEIGPQGWTGSVHSLTVKYIVDVTARRHFYDSTSVVSIRHLQLHLPMRGYGAGILGRSVSEGYCRYLIFCWITHYALVKPCIAYLVGSFPLGSELGNNLAGLEQALLRADAEANFRRRAWVYIPFLSCYMLHLGCIKQGVHWLSHTDPRAHKT